jgi:hypothetical protein
LKLYGIHGVIFQKISSSVTVQILGLRDEAPNPKTEDVIMRCLVRAIAHLRGRR